MAGSACLVAWLSFAGGCAQEPPRHAELQPAVSAAALDSLLARDTTGRLIELLGPDTMPRLYVIDRMGADPIRWLVMLKGVRKPPVDSAMVAREELERRKIPRELVMNFVAANLRPDSFAPASSATSTPAPSAADSAPPLARSRPGRQLGRAPAPASPDLPPLEAPMKKHRIFTTSVASVYPHYVRKAEAKGRTQQEVDEVICWLTGYTPTALAEQLAQRTDFETFFADAPALHPNAVKITGTICGVRIDDIEDPLMRNIRYLDKLVDELAKGRPMEKILRK